MSNRSASFFVEQRKRKREQKHFERLVHSEQPLGYGEAEEGHFIRSRPPRPPRPPAHQGCNALPGVALCSLEFGNALSANVSLQHDVVQQAVQDFTAHVEHSHQADVPPQAPLASVEPIISNEETAIVHPRKRKLEESSGRRALRLAREQARDIEKLLPLVPMLPTLMAMMRCDTPRLA